MPTACDPCEDDGRTDEETFFTGLGSGRAEVAGTITGIVDDTKVDGTLPSAELNENDGSGEGFEAQSGQQEGCSFRKAFWFV